jgi:hypothetical protein
MVDMRYGKGGACTGCGLAVVRDVEGKPTYVILGQGYFDMVVRRSSEQPITVSYRVDQNA